jgi:ABC-type cobalamin/Fe3+-siderophores transport system ATPase subunit
VTPILDDAATRHLDALAADARVHVGIVAPGGYGKTTLLHHLGARILATGTPVHTDLADATDGVLLVDDAHLFDDAELTRLRDLAAQVRLVVTARPWPRSAALTELLDLVQEQVLPTPFDREQV